MAIQSSDVVVGADILASSFNFLRADLLTNDINVSGVKYFQDHITVAATKHLHLDGGVDTYITEPSANVIQLITGGNVAFSVNYGDNCNIFGQNLVIPATKKFSLDGGGDTYITESSANVISFYAGGVRQMYLDSNGINVSAGYSLLLYNTGYAGEWWIINQNPTTTDLQFTQRFTDTSTNLAFYFTGVGSGYADVAWLTFSPDIKKDNKYKDKESLTAKDYLDWALDDAKKPVKPYSGIPKLKEKDEIAQVDNCIFNTQEEVEVEIEKYAKDISKIAIGIAKWAEQAELRIQALEGKV